MPRQNKSTACGESAGQGGQVKFYNSLDGSAETRLTDMLVVRCKRSLPAAPKAEGKRLNLWPRLTYESITFTEANRDITVSQVCENTPSNSPVVLHDSQAEIIILSDFVALATTANLAIVKNRGLCSLGDMALLSYFTQRHVVLDSLNQMAW